MSTATGNAKRKTAIGRATCGLAAMLAAAAIAPAPTAATPVPIEREGDTPHISADYTVYLGGLIVAEGKMDATLTADDYVLSSKLGVAGLPARFSDMTWSMTSEGRIAGAGLKPARFAFSETKSDEVKQRLIVYDAGGMPTRTFDPPLTPDEEPRIEPYEMRNTLDPVSIFLMPVKTTGNPCDRKLPVFDGKRRYDLQLVFDKEEFLTTRDGGFSGNTMRCKVRFNPRAGMERGKFATMLQRRDDTWIWLAPVNDGAVYIPVRVQLRTPVGGAVMDVVKLRQYATKSDAAAGAATE